MDEQKDDGRKQYREFKVTPGLHGFKVTIGCCEVYFDSVRGLGDAINSYLYDPQGMEKKMLAEDQRRGQLLPPTVPADGAYAQEAPTQEVCGIGERAFGGLQAPRR